MIQGVEALRSKIFQNVIKPQARIALRKLTPGWEIAVPHLPDYVDLTDLRNNSAQSNATGNTQEILGNWRTVIPHDTIGTNSAIIRFFQPWAYGETTNVLRVYSADNFANTAAWTVPLRTLFLNPLPKPRTRGGAYHANSLTGFFYLTNSGSVAHIPFTAIGIEQQTPQVIPGTQYYQQIYGGCIAPLNANEWLVLHSRPNDKRIFLDYYKNGAYVFRDLVLVMNYGNEIHWSNLHWFDAIAYGETIVFVASSHHFGASRAYSLYDGVVGGPYSIMSFDELDWTGTFRVASLSVINNRVYGVYGLRILLGDGGYSEEVWGLCWANAYRNWALPGYLVIGSGPIVGTVLVRNHEVGIVTATSVWRGEATADFGVYTNPNTQIDIQSIVRDFSYDALSDGTGASLKLNLDLGNKTPEEAIAPWWSDAHQVVLHIGVENDLRQAAVLWVDRPVRQQDLTHNVFTLSARGSLARLLETVRPTDDILEPAVQASHDMKNSVLIGRGNSIWESKDGRLCPIGPGENIAYHAEPITGTVYGNVKIVYENNALAFGLVFFAGGKEAQEEEYSYYLLSFYPQPNGELAWFLNRRIGRKTEANTWQQFTTTVRSGTLSGWGAGQARTLIFSLRHYVLRVWFHAPGNHPGVLLLEESIPDIPLESYYGLWAHTRHNRLNDSYFAGTRTLVMEKPVSDWPETGIVQIGPYRYSYTRQNNSTLLVTPGLQQFESRATPVVLTSSNVYFDVYNIASGHRRMNIAETVEKTAMYSGLFTRIGSAVFPTTFVTSGTVTRQNDVFIITNGRVETGLLVNTSKIGFYYQNLGENSSIAVVVGKSRFTFGRLNGSYYIQTQFTAPRAIPGGATKGWLHVALFEGWVHFYVNHNYVGSLPDKTVGENFAQLAFEGVDVRLGPFDIPIGHEMIAMGVWDARSSARTLLERILEGTPYFLTETEEVVVRLQSHYIHDDLGVVSPHYQVNINHLSQVLGVPTAYIAEGGYDWDVLIAFDALPRYGLNWGFLRNETMLNSASLRYFAGQHIRKTIQETHGLEMTGRPDIAAQINDMTTYNDRQYVIGGIHLLYTTNPPQFNARYELIGFRSDPNASQWSTMRWGSAYWS